MSERRRVSSNSPYEEIIGFSRAVRVGDVYLQARQTLRNIEKAQAGCTW